MICSPALHKVHRSQSNKIQKRLAEMKDHYHKPPSCSAATLNCLRYPSRIRGKGSRLKISLKVKRSINIARNRLSKNIRQLNTSSPSSNSLSLSTSKCLLSNKIAKVCLLNKMRCLTSKTSPRRSCKVCSHRTVSTPSQLSLKPLSL